MAIVPYTKQDEYDVVHENQDCIGWTVTDQTGSEFGKVTEMLVNTDTQMVDSVIVGGKARIPASDIALRDGRVVVRGVLHSEEYALSQQNTAATQASAESQTDYAAMENQTGAKHVAGVTRAANEDEIVLPVIEEQLAVGKRTVERGTARVQTRVEEIPVEESVTLREENVTVERRAADRPVESAPGAFQEGVIEVTEMAEVPVVAKEARVVEEVVVNKSVTEHQETVRDTVKRTDVDVDEVDANVQSNRNNG